MIGMPIYAGNIPVQTVNCLLNEQCLAAMAKDELVFNFLSNCSHPGMGRNQLAQQFLDSDCDRLIFVDSDVTFEVGSLIKLAKAEFDFVGGAYRFKIKNEQYPVGWIEKKELWANEQGLLEVAALPGGFLSLSKRVFEKLKEAHPDRGYKHFDRVAHCWFQMKFENGNLYGEDSYFCKEWTDLGEKVYLDPELSLTHWEYNRAYEGHIGKWLKNRG